LETLEKDKNLSKLLNTAFLVNIALSIEFEFGKKHKYRSFDFSKIKNRDDLVSTYLNQEIKKLEPEYPKARHYLSFLATKMNENEKGLNFELVDIKPYWSIVFSIIYFLCINIIGLFYFDLIDPILHVIQQFREFKFETDDIIWSVFVTYYLISRILLVTFFILFFINLWAFMFYTVALKTPAQRSFKKIKISLSDSFIDEDYLVLSPGLYFTTILIIGAFLFEGWVFFWYLFAALISFLLLPAIFRPQRTLNYENTYSIFLKPLWFSFIQILTFYIIIITIIFLFFDLEKYTFLFNNTNKLTLLYILLTNPIFIHFPLRLILYIEGNFPLRLRTFLNQVSGTLDIKDTNGNIIKKGIEGTGIMEKDGGQWRFRHQLIMDALISKRGE
jgi:hypothetical protein